MIHRCRVVVLSAIALLLSTAGMVATATAQPSASSLSAADVMEGNQIAHRLCVNCHIVDRNGPLVRTDRIPSFPWIAQQPGLTQEFITGWLSLSVSHDRMPDLSLTREEIRELSAYILSLKNP